MSIQRLPIPGFVDLQVNGFRGVDFSVPDLTEEAVGEAFQQILATGTAAFLPTLVSSSLEVYRRNLPLVAAVLRRREFQGRALGIHLEGPFLSPEPGARGAHLPEFIRRPDIRLLEQLLTWADGTARLVTLAPELPGAEKLISYAGGLGLLVSIGHTLATEDDLARAVDAGARALTHLGNGIPNLLPRHPNPIWAGLANDHLTAMVIADGHHLPGAVLKSFIRAKGVARTIVVSDASPLAGMAPGRYTTLGNEVILEESGRLYNPEKHCLVGSSSTMLQCMNHLANLALLNPSDLLEVGFYNPLRLLEIAPSSVVGRPRLLYDGRARAFSLDI
jgi:N-acetylglucosamine-6-phosphate deacetylase